jgi:hypothetical protein
LRQSFDSIGCVEEKKFTKSDSFSFVDLKFFQIPFNCLYTGTYAEEEEETKARGRPASILLHSSIFSSILSCFCLFGTFFFEIVVDV